MKVVLFCGGLGMRIRDGGDSVPKPMVTIGYRPILWHIMKYYAHHGHNDFILCLGYRGDVIKNYFLNYSECLSNDFVLSEGGKKLELMGSDIQDWKITFVETGLTSNIGQRLKAVERLLRGEREFLANYSDGLTDLSLPTQLQHFRDQNAVASFVSVKPGISYHLVTSAPGRAGHVDSTDRRLPDADQRRILRLPAGDLRLHRARATSSSRSRSSGSSANAGWSPTEYDGFWRSMDTFKDRTQLEAIYAAATRRGRSGTERRPTEHEPLRAVAGSAARGGAFAATTA